MRMDSKTVLTVSVMLYGLCLPVEAFCQAGKCYGSGIEILGFGWLSLGHGFASIAWLANPALFVAWISILARLKTVALATSLSAFALAASFLLARNVITNEGLVPVPITGYRIGYWLWLASTGVAVVAAKRINPHT